jgi:hypothetical protein
MVDAISPSKSMGEYTPDHKAWVKKQNTQVSTNNKKRIKNMVILLRLWTETCPI